MVSSYVFYISLSPWLCLMFLSTITVLISKVPWYLTFSRILMHKLYHLMLTYFFGPVFQPSALNFQISWASFLSCNIQFHVWDLFADFLAPISLLRIESIRHLSWFLSALHKFSRLCCTWSARFRGYTSSCISLVLLAFLDCHVLLEH